MKTTQIIIRPITKAGQSGLCPEAPKFREELIRERQNKRAAASAMLFIVTALLKGVESPHPV